MSMKTQRSLATLVLAAAVPCCAHAQLAVIDVPAIAQLVQQVQSLQQEVETAQNQLAQARQALATMTGNRGMEMLLHGTTRNYLPATWSQLAGAMHGVTAGSGGLASLVQAGVAANAVLHPEQLAVLSHADQQRISTERQVNALRQALSQAALDNVSGRFAAIQTLIDAIGGAADQKAVLDLQARIAAELGMLENEQTKLQVLDRAMQVQNAIAEQKQREQFIADQGNFARRFRPVP